MKNSTKKAIGVGAGVLTAAAVAAAAAYMLKDTEAVKKGKAKAKAWVALAKKEVIKNAKTASKLGAAEYAMLVEQAVRRYGELKKATPGEILAAVKEMKGEWKKIQQHAENIAKAGAGGKTKKAASRRESSRKSK